MTNSVQNKLNLLESLQKEAKLQAQLETKKILPKQIGGMASLAARYPWQMIAGASFLTSLIIRLLSNN